MQLAWVFLGSALGLGLIAIFSRICLELELSGRGDASGGWAAASGIGVGPFALTGVIASVAPLRVELHVFGRRVPMRRFEHHMSRSDPRITPEPAENEKRLEPARGKFALFDRDLVDLLAFALHERRRFAIESLQVELGYGFSDVALTGKVLGALYALSGVLPRQVKLIQTPRWDGGETWEGTARGRVALWPGLVLVEVLWYMLRRRAKRSGRVAPAIPDVGSRNE